jgi:iron complex outermembrane recepter protein
MSIRAARRMLFSSALLFTLPFAAQAQDAPAADPQAEEDIRSASEIVVTGSIGYRFREDDAAEPILVYDTDYFQRFEPLTAGDALKRVPSVTFLSDVIESDGARLRGLPPGYTQILINGDKVPGSNADRSFFLDRIPAELVERVEIVRSSSARRTGDAVAGTLNIKLRDGYQIDGGYLRAGGLYFDDKEFEPSLGGVFGTEVGPGRLLVGLNFQGRHNPKKKFSLRYSDSPENDPSFATAAFVNREDQIDTRDGKDYSANIDYRIEGASTDLALTAFYVHTDRREDERSFEYNSATAINGPVRAAIPGNLLSDNANVVDISQDSYSVAGKLAHRWSAGETKLRVSYASFENTEFETEFEIDFDRSTPRFTGDVTQLNIRDREFSAGLEHEVEVADDIKFAVGAFYQDKQRRTLIGEDRNRFNLTVQERNWNQFVGNPTGFATPFDPVVPGPGNNNRIGEERLDGFAVVEGKSGGLRWEVGVRYETTDVTINDFTVAAAQQRQTNDYAEWLPSASLRLDIGNRGRLTASAARTLRRPELNFISPALLGAELGDNDLLGNPQLDPETAWGGDIGYEHRLGKSGIAGVNIFYRDVSNLIEVTNTLLVGSEGPGTFIQHRRRQSVGH